MVKELTILTRAHHMHPTFVRERVNFKHEQRSDAYG